MGTTTTGKDISNGVVDIQMTIDPTTSKSNVIQTDFHAQLQLQLSDIIQFDLIIYYIPCNTESNWIAFAFANNREVCQYSAIHPCKNYCCWVGVCHNDVDTERKGNKYQNFNN